MRVTLPEDSKMALEPAMGAVITKPYALIVKNHNIAWSITSQHNPDG